MALTNCKECGTQISKKATSCPKCGNVLRKPKRGIFGLLFLWVFILFNALMAWYTYEFIYIVTQSTDINSAGEIIGGTIGTGLVLSVWLFGAIITGLFALLTRAK